MAHAEAVLSRPRPPPMSLAATPTDMSEIVLGPGWDAVVGGGGVSDVSARLGEVTLGPARVAAGRFGSAAAAAAAAGGGAVADR